jgi:RinA family phage transcriptional activator
MDRMKPLRDAQRKAVAEQLKAYYYTKELLQEWESDLAYGGAVSFTDGLPGAKSIKKPTEEHAIRLADHTIVKTLRRTINAIEQVKNQSYGKKADVLLEYYFRGKPAETVSMDVHVDRATVYRYAKEILEDAAELLGYQV